MRALPGVRLAATALALVLVGCSEDELRGVGTERPPPPGDHSDRPQAPEIARPADRSGQLEPLALPEIPPACPGLDIADRPAAIPLSIGELGGVAAGDLDGDGGVDVVLGARNGGGIVTASSTGGNVVVSELAEFGDLTDVMLVDLDGDGADEVVAIGYFNGLVEIFDRSDSGSFYPRQTLVTDGPPAAVAALDCDDDGTLDLAITSYETGDVEIWRGGQDGDYAASGLFSLESGTYGIAALPIDGDERVDLAVANLDEGSVALLRGVGDCGFEEVSTFSTGPVPYVFSRDIDSDGQLDLLVTSHANYGSLHVIRAPAEFPVDVTSVPFGFSPTAVHLADLDGDGNLDLIGPSYSRPELHVGFGRPDGTFGDWTVFNQHAPVLAGGLLDFDGDGLLDYVGGDRETSDVSILRGHEEHLFDSRIAFPLGGKFPDVAVVDFNDDGRADVVAVDQTGGALLALRATPRGFLQPAAPPHPIAPEPFTISAWNDPATKAALVAVGHRFDEHLEVLEVDANGAMEARANVTIGQAWDVVADDLDSDGEIDLVVSLPEKDQLALLLGEGGAFDGPNFAAAPGAPGSVAVHRRRHREPTIVAANFLGGDLAFYELAGGMLIEVERTAPLDEGLISVATGDVDNDGEDEVVAGSYYTGAIYLVRGGDPARKLRLGLAIDYLRDLKLIDLDGDSLPEILAVGENGELGICRPRDDANCERSKYYFAGWNAYSVAAADLDGNGARDIITANDWDGTVGVLHRECAIPAAD